MADEQRTLEELEGQDWGAPESAPTPMLARCLALRRTSLSMLSPGDLRLLLGQQIGLKYLVPKALGLVADQPLQEADLYPGDLLSVLLQVDKKFWAHHPTELHWLLSIARSVAQQYGTIIDGPRRSETISDYLQRAITNALPPSAAVVFNTICQPPRMASLHTMLLQCVAFHSAAWRSFQASVIDADEAYVKRLNSIILRSQETNIPALRVALSIQRPTSVSAAIESC